MSRYQVEPKNNSQNLEIIVGYDQPLDTFFRQVYKLPTEEGTDDTDDTMLLWIGTDRQEITHVWQFAITVHPVGKKFNLSAIGKKFNLSAKGMLSPPRSRVACYQPVGTIPLISCNKLLLYFDQPPV